MDLPKGKTIWLFDQTDMARAKETIGQVACIQGNVPLVADARGHRGRDGRVQPRHSSTPPARGAASSWTSARWPTEAKRRTCGP